MQETYSKVDEVKSNQELTQIFNENKVVFVDFSATWCGPCRQVAPKFEAWSEDSKYSTIKFCKVDVDKAKDVATFARIKSLPTFMLYIDGVETARIVGANIPVIENTLGEHAKSD